MEPNPALYLAGLCSLFVSLPCLRSPCAVPVCLIQRERKKLPQSFLLFKSFVTSLHSLAPNVHHTVNKERKRREQFTTRKDGRSTRLEARCVEEKGV